MFVESPILFSKANFSTEVAFDGTYLTVSSKLKTLGVTLDSNFNFTIFAFQLIQESNFHLYAIKKLGKILPFNTAVALTISLVHP